MKILRAFIFLSLAISVKVYGQKNKTTMLASAFTQGGASPQWPAISLANPDNVTLDGSLGQSFQRGLKRIGLPPYSLDWLLSDVSFKVDRIFTNYSGDISGRFLELCVLTSPSGQLLPATTLPAALKTITDYQQADGHFGANFDVNKTMKSACPEITMLWGNARLLVGLVTAGVKLHDQKLLASAQRLGDFYVNTGDQLRSPAREAEFRATGSDAAGYTCGYFPAMEGLVMLYKATGHERYLHEAERIAEWFKKFDSLPIDHSHANLSAWRGILDLYEVTCKHEYLDGAIAKWENAVGNGFVWEPGGVGEHWNPLSGMTEGCSETDWLIFNLRLWRWTGQTRYLDMAERLLDNLYIAGQTPNGGFGQRYLENDPLGPIALIGSLVEANCCCSFHGPLGLYFLKSYLATGSKRNLYINMPLNFEAPVRAGDTDWRISVKSDSVFNSKWEKKMAIACSAGTAKSARPVTVWVRMPSWASEARIDGAPGPLKVEHGYIVLKRNCQHGFKYVVTFKSELSIEGRNFTAIKPTAGQCSTFKDISLLIGPRILLETPSHGPGLSNILATIDKQGRLDLLQDSDGGYASVELPDINITKSQVLQALDSSRKVSLKPLFVSPGGRASFAYNLIVVPAEEIPTAVRSRFANRVKESDVVHYGNNLEKNTALWPATLPWEFMPKGILVKGGPQSIMAIGGGIGLMEGKGYLDYQFAFDLTLPLEGDGITGWIVRAADEENCILFQLQSNDTMYDYPGFKNQANSLRMSVCRNGEWKTVGEPISLSKEIRKGESHHIRTECSQDQVKVFLDGQPVFEHSDEGLQTGGVGFRVLDTHEQGLFENIGLNKIGRR